jgi:hypothetical protein
VCVCVCVCVWCVCVVHCAEYVKRRVIFHKLENCAYSWFYYRKLVTCCENSIGQ